MCITMQTDILPYYFVQLFPANVYAYMFYQYYLAIKGIVCKQNHMLLLQIEFRLNLYTYLKFKMQSSISIRESKGSLSAFIMSDYFK